MVLLCAQHSSEKARKLNSEPAEARNLSFTVRHQSKWEDGRVGVEVLEVQIVERVEEGAATKEEHAEAFVHSVTM